MKTNVLPEGMTVRKMMVKTYHAVKGDGLIMAEVVARADRPVDDPFFAGVAKKLARGLGKVIEWKVS